MRAESYKEKGVRDHFERVKASWTGHQEPWTGRCWCPGLGSERAAAGGRTSCLCSVSFQPDLKKLTPKLKHHNFQKLCNKNNKGSF